MIWPAPVEELHDTRWSCQGDLRGPAGGAASPGFPLRPAARQGLLYDDVTRSGWFLENLPVRARWQTAVPLTAAGAGLTFLLAHTLRTRFGLVGVAVVVCGLLLLVLSPRMPARTPKGTALLAQAKGFRTYLETAEANQIKFEEGEDIFSRYLPFAIVFGVAERWAKVFADLAASGAPVVAPTWYVGPMWAGGINYPGFGVDGFFADDVRLDRRCDALVVRILRIRRGRLLRRWWRRWWWRLLVSPDPAPSRLPGVKQAGSRLGTRRDPWCVPLSAVVIRHGPGYAGAGRAPRWAGVPS
jgi:hypothetical protein